MPRLTIGLPLRNSSQFLRQAIDSVLTQTFTDWMLLAIDDASTDSTAEIVRAYAEKDNRIRLLQYGPQPVSHAENWNRVIRLAETEYVSMFGHDDIMMPDLLAREIRMMDDHPQMVMTFAQGPLIDDQGALLRSKRGNSIMQPNWPDDRMLPQYTLGPQLICEGFVHPSSVMLRTKVAQSIPLFPENMLLYLDIDYWSRVGDCGPVAYVAGDLLRYRVRSDSATAWGIRAGLNFTDAHHLFERMMAHWNWDDIKRENYNTEFYSAHAVRALRAAEMAWESGDFPTMRLQVAICLSLAKTAGQNRLEWIARWLNIRLFKKRFSSAARLKLLTTLLSVPGIRTFLIWHFTHPTLPNI